jgi:hypothetical protein
MNMTGTQSEREITLLAVSRKVPCEEDHYTTQNKETYDPF